MRVGRLVTEEEGEGGEERGGGASHTTKQASAPATTTSGGGCPIHGGGGGGSGGGGGALSSGANTSPPTYMDELLGDPTKPFVEGRSYWYVLGVGLGLTHHGGQELLVRIRRRITLTMTPHHDPSP